MSSIKLINFFLCILFFSAYIRPASVIAKLPYAYGFFSKFITDYRAGTAKVLSKSKFFKFKKNPFKPNWEAYDLRKKLFLKYFEQQEREQLGLIVFSERSFDKKADNSSFYFKPNNK